MSKGSKLLGLKLKLEPVASRWFAAMAVCAPTIESCWWTGAFLFRSIGKGSRWIRPRNAVFSDILVRNCDKKLQECWRGRRNLRGFKLSVFCELYSRDRVVTFGKHNGHLLGTMSSSYLKWMAKNLRQGALEEWAGYAEEVLQDPYYKDRLEYEKAEKMMAMAHGAENWKAMSPANIYGWDLDDEAGWNKVNFSLLGTTLGGRIPRKREPVPEVNSARDVEKKKRSRKKSVSVRSSLSSPDNPSSGSLRDELLRRRERRRDRLMANRVPSDVYIEEDSRAATPFPGRDVILRKVRDQDTSKLD